MWYCISVHATTSIIIPKQKQPGCKEVLGQSEARLQMIKEGQEDKTFHD